MNQLKEIAEKVIPVTDSLHARLSEMKGKLRCTFNELIEMMADALDEKEGVKNEVP